MIGKKVHKATRDETFLVFRPQESVRFPNHKGAETALNSPLILSGAMLEGGSACLEYLPSAQTIRGSQSGAVKLMETPPDSAGSP